VLDGDGKTGQTTSTEPAQGCQSTPVASSSSPRYRAMCFAPRKPSTYFVLLYCGCADAAIAGSCILIQEKPNLLLLQPSGIDVRCVISIMFRPSQRVQRATKPLIDRFALRNAYPPCRCTCHVSPPPSWQTKCPQQQKKQTPPSAAVLSNHYRRTASFPSREALLQFHPIHHQHALRFKLQYRFAAILEFAPLAAWLISQYSQSLMSGGGISSSLLTIHVLLLRLILSFA
jgi:hypothetical protein